MAPTITESTGAAHTRLLSVAGYRGSRVVDNEEMCTMIDSSDEWIRQRTGIAERRWSTDEETPLYMAVQAGRQAIERAGLTAADIDGVLVATVSHHMPSPSLAVSVCRELGIGDAAAMDVSAACAGFCYLIETASALVRAGSAHNVLIIGVEKLSSMINIEDRSTAFLFADGAGAAVVGAADTPGIGPAVWGSDGEQADVIEIQDWRDVPAGQPMPFITM
jgi:3-oxoacyl-[acyl-carrier-protein] synthase-3